MDKIDVPGMITIEKNILHLRHCPPFTCKSVALKEALGCTIIKPVFEAFSIHVYNRKIRGETSQTK